MLEEHFKGRFLRLFYFYFVFGSCQFLFYAVEALFDGVEAQACGGAYVFERHLFEAEGQEVALVFA